MEKNLKYDVVVIGAGISGLTSASLLAKRGIHVAVIDNNYNPGGSCGIFKRNDIVFDQGASMLFGFGEKGFNAHRFVFNSLEEPINIIQHEILYSVNFKGHNIKFWSDVEMFIQELSLVFPDQKENIARFYHDILKIYQHVMVETPSYTTPDETDSKGALKSLLKHPVSYAKFLGYLNKSTESLLKEYFSDPEIFKFFDKLTSTYCYTTVKESPAVLAAVMFVDNHVGGSYYPAGSTMFLPGKLEKAIEENGGDMIYQSEVTSILMEKNKVIGVELKNGDKIFADNVIYSGTVWNLYEKLINKKYLTNKEIKWAENQIPTYPSVVLYAYVDQNVISENTAPIEMLVGNPDHIDECEVTVYIFSIDDKTLCPKDGHVVMAIGPTFANWDTFDNNEYEQKKETEKARLIKVLEKRFPGFEKAIRYAEVATPRTIERYTLKNGGAVAGPKQMLGQHMFKRLHTKSRWENLYNCGESTVMGTGTPTVTTSGLSAANAVLKKIGLEPFVYKKDLKNYVTILDRPFTREQLYTEYPEELREVILKAAKCQYCERPTCSLDFDIRGIMRRLSVGNLKGAGKIIKKYASGNNLDENFLKECESNCILKKQNLQNMQNIKNSNPVEILNIVEYLKEKV